MSTADVNRRSSAVRPARGLFGNSGALHDLQDCGSGLRTQSPANATLQISGVVHGPLEESIRANGAARNSGKPFPSVAVNLSALQLLDPSLVERVKSAISRHQVQPRQLVLEITETTAMRNVDVSMRILQQLHEVGVRISIDDFGTGYSSLLHLKRLPATELKIDRGFVRDLREGGEDCAIISAIIALNKTLNLTVVAEGVETLEQQAFLTETGCDSLQGFLLGKPVSPEKLSALFPKQGASSIDSSMFTLTEA